MIEAKRPANRLSLDHHGRNSRHCMSGRNRERFDPLYRGSIVRITPHQELATPLLDLHPCRNTDDSVSAPISVAYGHYGDSEKDETITGDSMDWTFSLPSLAYWQGTHEFAHLSRLIVALFAANLLPAGPFCDGRTPLFKSSRICRRSAPTGSGASLPLQGAAQNLPIRGNRSSSGFAIRLSQWCCRTTELDLRRDREQLPSGHGSQ